LFAEGETDLDIRKRACHLQVLLVSLTIYF
jgi:hypothetical protein